jgi:hypothetical protein
VPQVGRLIADRLDGCRVGCGFDDDADGLRIAEDPPDLIRS